MTENSHQVLRESLGAFVLGHLDPAEADAVHAHLATCAECRAEVDELVPVASALAGAWRAPATAAKAASLPRGLRARMDAAIASESGRQRRSRAVSRAGTLLVAAALVVLAAIGVSSLISAPAEAPVPEIVAVEVDPSLSSVTASAGLIAHTWGVEIKLQTTGLDAGATYQAMIQGAGDRTYPAGTFTGTGPNTINCNLQASVLRDDAEGFMILDDQGKIVISSEF